MYGFILLLLVITLIIGLCIFNFNNSSSPSSSSCCISSLKSTNKFHYKYKQNDIIIREEKISDQKKESKNWGIVKHKNSIYVAHNDLGIVGNYDKEGKLIFSFTIPPAPNSTSINKIGSPVGIVYNYYPDNGSVKTGLHYNTENDSFIIED